MASILQAESHSLSSRHRTVIVDITETIQPPCFLFLIDSVKIILYLLSVLSLPSLFLVLAFLVYFIYSLHSSVFNKASFCPNISFFDGVYSWRTDTRLTESFWVANEELLCVRYAAVSVDATVDADITMSVVLTVFCKAFYNRWHPWEKLFVYTKSFEWVVRVVIIVSGFERRLPNELRPLTAIATVAVSNHAVQAFWEIEIWRS
jgi:hypothetical protein